ncbi:MAG TPA: heavy metal translocating P-type ATPase [Candidatus Chromulinivoraceae bacterium]|nr:heavy metal translocating P-type ATPase [Candidatus Chromulinivoraceae bacterium]
MNDLQRFIKSYPLVSLVLVCILISAVFETVNFHSGAVALLSFFSLVVAIKLGYEMIMTLREGRYGIDILAVTAIISTIAVGEQWAAIIIVLMLTGGEALEDYAANRAKRELNDLLERAPQTAHKIVGNSVETIPLIQVRIGDHLLVKPGEVVPVDATLESPAAELDESSLTGESLPVTYKKGEQLLSGSINGSGSITIKVLKTAEDSQYQQIIKLVKSATSVPAPFVRLADRYAVPFTLISFAIAGVAWTLSGNPLRFAEVLVVATPCPLLLAAPIALISGMSRAAKNGIIIKNGAILERLADTRVVAFDKTGTLTHGEPDIQKIYAANGFKESEVLAYAASAEQQSVHVLAQALITETKKQHITIHSPTNVSEVIAQGITATVQGKKVLVGKFAFLKHEDIKIHETALKSGETAVYVAVDGKFAGAITFSDRVRPESKQAIRELAAMHITKTLMLTGDSQGTASRIAKEVGITDIHAECLPIDKVNVVRNLSTRPVMMVGDGVNDAPVLAVADVGMAMGARGSTAASETADVVVLVDDIQKSAQAIQIAKRTISIALQSIWVGIAISIILMLIASTGFIPAIVGAVLQEVVDVIVIFNALRAHGPWQLQRH